MSNHNTSLGVCRSYNACVQRAVDVACKVDVCLEDQLANSASLPPEQPSGSADFQKFHSPKGSE